MPLPKAGPLSADSFDSFFRRVQADEATKNLAIREIERDVAAFMEQTFTLTGEQSDRMKPLKSPKFAEVCARMLATGLRQGWKIEFRDERHDPHNMMVSVWCILDLCGVRFYL
jgi:hypothetical protein